MAGTIVKTHYDPSNAGNFSPWIFIANDPGLVDFGQGWIWVKLICVALLVAFHFFLAAPSHAAFRNKPVHAKNPRFYPTLKHQPFFNF